MSALLALPIWPFLLTFNVLLLAVGLWLTHQTFKHHQRNEKKANLWQQLENLWTPAIEDYLKHPEDPGPVWQTVQEHQGLYFIDFLLRMSRKHPTKTGSLEELARPYLPRLAHRLNTNEGDSEQRARAVQTLDILGSSADIQQLAECLEDPSPQVVLLAAHALSRHGQSHYISEILAQLTRLARWNLPFLIRLLVKMGPDILEAVRLHLQSTTTPEDQVVCLQVAARLRDELTAPLAVRLLSESQDINVQVAALAVLGNTGLTEHTPLIRSFYSSPHFAVRLAVMRALHDLSAQDEQLYQQGIEDRSHWVALEAAQALKASGQQHVLHEMTFLQHPRAELATQVLQSMNNLEELEQSVQRADFKERVGMIFQRFQDYDPREVQQVITRLFFNPDTHPEVRYAMARELENFKSYQFFYQALSSFVLGWHDQRALIRALRSFANPEAVPALIQFYRSGKASNKEKIEVVEALGAIDVLESLTFLSRVYNEVCELEAQTPETLLLQQSLASALAQKMLA